MPRRLLALAGLTMLAPPLGAATIDHLVLGVSALDAGMAEFRAAAGVEPVFGGQHPGGGTQNALASLGKETYIEIIAPVPGESLDPRWAAITSFQRLTPMTWAVGVEERRGAGARAPGARPLHGGPLPGVAGRARIAPATRRAPRPGGHGRGGSRRHGLHAPLPQGRRRVGVAVRRSPASPGSPSPFGNLRRSPPAAAARAPWSPATAACCAT